MSDSETLVIEAIRKLGGYSRFVTIQEVEASTNLDKTALEKTLINLDKQGLLGHVGVRHDSAVHAKIPTIFKL